LGEVSIGLLDEQTVAKVQHIAVEGEPISITRLVQQQHGLPDEVEREICETDVNFENGPVAAPFADALPKHERIVAEAQ
jgi:hypothetical protein